MQIYEALRRRGVAYAFADLLEWTVHERHISHFFGHLRKDPPQGHVKTSTQQLLRADRAVMQQCQQLFTALRLPFIWARRRNLFRFPRMNGRSNSGELDDESCMAPKVFKHKDCVSVDHHGRRLCFGSRSARRCQMEPNANHGWHLVKVWF